MLQYRLKDSIQNLYSIYCKFTILNSGVQKRSRQKWNLRTPLFYEVRLAFVKKLRAK